MGREKETVKGMEVGRLVGFSSRMARPEQGPSGFPMVPTASGTQMNLLSSSMGVGGTAEDYPPRYSGQLFQLVPICPLTDPGFSIGHLGRYFSGTWPES